MSTTRPSDWMELRNHLDGELRRQGIDPDTYDVDFILGSIQIKLGVMDAALTSEGVRKFKRR